MTAAYRLKGIGWFATVVGVVLGFYLISLQVAAERKKLDQLNTSIRVAERDIRALETEFDTRANLAQLERWNGDTLALVAPVAGQFLRDEAQLASIRFDGMPGAETRTAAMVVPALPLPADPAEPPAEAAIAPAIVVQPAAPAPAPALIRAAAPARPESPSVRMAARPTLIRAAATASIRRKPQVAMLDRQLLSDTTFGDIVSGARAESARLR